MILDHAAKLIAKEGVSAVSMETVSNEAGISKVLAYKYYASVTILLRALLTREYGYLRNLLWVAAKEAETLEQLVRQTTKVYLAYIEEHGLLIERLEAEPAVINYGDLPERGHAETIMYLAQILHDNFDIGTDLALPIAEISHGLLTAASHYIVHNETKRQTVEDITVTMMLASLESIQKKSQGSPRLLVEREPKKRNQQDFLASRTDAPKKIRTRLSPKARKAMILDHAAKLVANEGVSAVSIERVSLEAGISKALAYNHYSSVTSLLQALLVREYRHLRRLQLDTVESTETLEQMVQQSTRVYLSYIKEHGLLIERLEAEPAIANYGDPSEYGNFATVMYLAQILKDNFGIEIETALVITEISYGLPAAGGRYLIHNEANLQTIENIVAKMVLASLESTQRKCQFSMRRLHKYKRPKGDRIKQS